MFTTFTALALAGGALRLVLQWQLKTRWGISLAVPQILAGATCRACWPAELPAALPLSSASGAYSWPAVA